jgi:hypothetical protein
MGYKPVGRTTSIGGSAVKIGIICYGVSIEFGKMVLLPSYLARDADIALTWRGASRNGGNKSVHPGWL